MLEGLIGQPGEAGERAGAGLWRAFERDRVEIGARPLAPILGGAVVDRLAGPTEMLEDGDPARSPAGSGKEAGHPARRRSVFRQHEAPPARREMEAQALQWTGVEAQRGATGKRPAQPGGGEAEGARLRHDCHLLAAKMVREHNADPVPQRVAARQHRDAGAAARCDLGNRFDERLAPHEPLGLARRHHRQMAGAANQGLRGLDQGARGGAQAGEPVLADADDAEPARHAGALPLSALTAAAASALPPRRPLSVI